MSLLFAGPKTASTKPTYTGVQTQTSSGTMALGPGWGVNRIAPNITWTGDFTQTASDQNVGKGMGGGSTTTYTYTTSLIMALCVGPINGIGAVWQDQSETGGPNADTTLGFTRFIGGMTQSAWGYLTTNHPDEALNYHGIAYVAQANYSLGDSPNLPNHNFEVFGFFEGTAPNNCDADPALVIQDFLTNGRYGVSHAFNSVLDTSTLLSTSSATTTGDGTFQTYCQAMGLGMSPFLVNQESGASILDRWCQLMNAAAVWNGYALKIIPYADVAFTANGYHYIPPIDSVYTLTDDDYVATDASTDPVIMTRADPAQAANSLTLVFKNRANGYNQEPMEIRLDGLVDLYGLIPASQVNSDEICDHTIAARCVQFMLQRSGFLLNQFTFSLSWEYSLLEPMDVVTLTLTDAGLGLTELPVRILEIDEQDDGTFQIIAEEFAAGMSDAAVYARQTINNVPINRLNDPGDVAAPVIFEPRSDLANGKPQVWMSISGAGQYWGGAQVWISFDDVTYQNIGEVKKGGRQGVLSANLATYGGANPDTGHTLAVDMSDSHGKLKSASATQASRGVTLCYVDGELLSYQTATLTGTDQYSLTNLYRGLYGSTVGAHSSGSQFARLDGSVFKFTLPAANVGDTIYLKFASFNIWGRAVQDLGDISPYTITPTGQGFYIPPSSLTAKTAKHAVRLNWSGAKNQAGMDGYVVYGYQGTTTDFSLATELRRVKGTRWTYSGLELGVTWTFWVTTYSDTYDWESAPAGPLTVVRKLTAPANADITVVGVTTLAKDGTAKPRLSVSSSVAQPDQNLYVRWRTAAGAYPGMDSAYDFLAGVYQLDAGAIDPESTWVDAPHKIRGKTPQGLFGGFDGGELLDVETQWRGPDGLISDWQLTQNVSIPGKTSAATPVASVTSAAHAGFNTSKWARCPDQDFAEFWAFRTTTGTVAPGSTPDWTGRQKTWNDPDGTPGVTYIYVVFALNRSQTAPDWTAGTAGNAVTSRLAQDGDIDPTLPANPALTPALAKILTIDPVSGLPVLQLQATITAEASEVAYVVALNRNSNGYAPQRIEAAGATTLAFWNVNVGDVCQVKHKLINSLGRKSSAYGSVASLTITGDSTAPGVVTTGSATVNAKQDGSLMAKGWAWPGNLDLIGGLLWVGTSSSAGSATTFAGFVSLHQLHARIEAVYVTVATPAYVFLQTVDSSGNTSAKTLVGNDTPRAIQYNDVGANQIDAGYHLTGNLQTGQAITLSSGISVATGAQVLRTTCSDGDVVSFGVTLGALPDIDFLTGVLPAPTAGNIYVGTAVGLSLTGFTASIKQVTPAVITAQNTGAGASDATIPHPGMTANGFSVAKGVTANAYNQIYRANLNLSFTTTSGGKTGAATISVYRWNGSVWSKITDVLFVAGTNGSFTGNVSGSWSSGLAMASTDKWGFQVLSFNNGTAGCTINSLGAVVFKTQTTTSPTTATPNREDVPVIIWVKNV